MQKLICDEVVKSGIYAEAKRYSSITTAKPYLESLRISEQISNTLAGFELQFL